MHEGTIAAIAFVLAVATCQSGSLLGRPDSEPALFEKRWVGHAEDELLVQYGRPDETLALSSGNRMIGFHKEMRFASAGGGSYQAIASYQANAGTEYCDRRFEIDKDTTRVVRAVISGNACDYSR